MAKPKDTKMLNETQPKLYVPEFYLNPLEKAVWDIENIVIRSGLPYNIEYRPDDGYFSLELYNKN